MFTKILLLAACAISSAVALQSDWNQQTRNQIMKIHNDYRRNEGACQMQKLEYDMELEAQAKVWAEGCAFRHEMKKGRGENLAYSTYKHAEAKLITDAAQAWFDEKKDYRPGQKGCQRSCHYTQLVWHNTEKVGCYSGRCPSLAGANARNAWYLVCFYTPMGNWVGQEPYKTTCDAPCHNGQKQENGLCAGKAILPCVDDKANCAMWAKHQYCTKNADYMKKHCRKSCKLC